jgi:glycosyltransferase involved in cell wall biosynthesis
VLLGPVGGLVRVPPALLRRHVPIGSELLREFVRDCAVWTATRNPLLRSALKRCDQLFVQSSVDRTRLSRIVACEPEILTNSGVIEAAASPNSEAHPVPGRLVFAGDLKYAKGVLLLPELVKSLPASYHLVIYGEGPAKRALQRAIASYGLQDRVHLAGRVTQTEVREALARAECMVLPSFREGAPAIVSEAVQAGCRVVALDVGGIGAIFSRVGAGVRLVPVGAADLTEELRIAVLAVAESAQDASVETWAQKGDRLYASVSTGALS